MNGFGWKRGTFGEKRIGTENKLRDNGKYIVVIAKFNRRRDNKTWAILFCATKHSTMGKIIG